MTNSKFKEMVMNYKTLSTADKIVLRSGWKARIYGVHTAAFKSEPGTSNLAHYVKHNPAAAKEMIIEEIKCIKIMRERSNF